MKKVLQSRAIDSTDIDRDTNLTMQAINNIVVPQGLEYQAVCRGLVQAKAKGVRVIAVPIGDRHTQEVLANYSQQWGDALLITGLCGSLCESHSVGDGVVVKSCSNLNGDRLNLDDELTTMIQHKLSVDAVHGLTSDRLISQSSEKLKLAREHQASIVDMEGYGYISYLQQQGAVAMLRVVSDDRQGDIPDLDRAIDERGQLKNIPLAIALCKQPVAAMRLIRGSITGLKALQQITTRLFT